jgi:hypothetical protein
MLSVFAVAKDIQVRAANGTRWRVFWSPQTSRQAAAPVPEREIARKISQNSSSDSIGYGQCGNTNQRTRGCRPKTTWMRGETRISP